MDLVQKEHERLWKRLKSAKGISDVQATIDLLQEARDTIAAGTSTTNCLLTLAAVHANALPLDPTKASITLAKLQNPVKASFDATNETLKETHSSLNKYQKALDKVSCGSGETLPCPRMFD